MPISSSAGAGSSREAGFTAPAPSAPSPGAVQPLAEGDAPGTPGPQAGTEPSSCRLITQGGEFRAVLLERIRAARHEILAEIYILHMDEFGAEILHALEEAAERGVHVRFIVDGHGSVDFIREEHERMRRSRIEFRVFHPLPWPISSLGNRLTADRLARVMRLFLKVNRRDHRKVWVFDRETAILGSHNLWRESLEWNEVGVCFSGEAVAEVIESWDMVWVRSYNLRLAKRRRIAIRERLRRHPFHRTTQVLTNTSRLRKRWRYRTILKLLDGARQRIWITTPYLYPHVSFLRLLNRKARAGLDVRILVPEESDVPFERWLSQGIYVDLLSARIGIYELSKPILHAKVLLADDALIIGSSNFNHRSFHRDLEIDYFTREPALVARMEAWKEANFRRANCISSAEEVEYLFLKKCLCRLVTPMRSWF